MQKTFFAPILAGLMLAVMGSTTVNSAQDALNAEQVTSFVASVSKSNGADLGGLKDVDTQAASRFGEALSSSS